jgi:hypothetical protein
MHTIAKQNKKNHKNTAVSPPKIPLPYTIPEAPNIKKKPTKKPATIPAVP